MNARNLTAAIIILGPLLVIVYDFIVWVVYGSASTITGVIRDWADESTWPMFLYVVGAVVLYLHLFCGWPDIKGGR